MVCITTCFIALPSYKSLVRNKSFSPTPIFRQPSMYLFMFSLAVNGMCVFFVANFFTDPFLTTLARVQSRTPSFRDSWKVLPRVLNFLLVSDTIHHWQSSICSFNDILFRSFPGFFFPPFFLTGFFFLADFFFFGGSSCSAAGTHDLTGFFAAGFGAFGGARRGGGAGAGSSSSSSSSSLSLSSF